MSAAKSQRFAFTRWPHAARVKVGRFSLTLCWKAVGP